MSQVVGCGDGSATSMRAAVVEKFGQGPVVKLVQKPELAAGTVLLSVSFAAVSFVDLLLLSGQHQAKPMLPYIPGTECAGVVAAIGEGVKTFSAGDRVRALALAGGGWAEALVIPEAAVSHFPAAMDPPEAATFYVGHATAFHALVQRAMAREGETVLVLGAGGAIGQASVNVALALGLRVIAAASHHEARLQSLERGAIAAIDSRRPFKAQLLEIGAPQVDIVIDPVGGDATEQAFRCLAWGGRHLVLGFAAEAIPKLPTNLPLLKGASLVGVDLRQFEMRQPDVSKANRQAIFDLYDRGLLHASAPKIFSLDRVDAAIIACRQRAVSSRVVLNVAERLF